MDKERFLRLAPMYYAVAIAAYFKSGTRSVAFKPAIQGYYALQEGDSYLGRDALFMAGAKTAIEMGLIDLVEDDFGPAIYKRSENFYGNWPLEAGRTGSPFQKYDVMEDNAYGWLLDALESVEAHYVRLGIQDEDFIEADRDWQPIPLDREDEELANAVAKLDEVTENLRRENGYAATAPEEKRHVLDRLNAARQRLKEDVQISVAYLRTFVFEPLGTLMTRFGKASLGLLAAAARSAFSDWLKKRGISFLDGWLGPG